MLWEFVCGCCLQYRLRPWWFELEFGSFLLGTSKEEELQESMGMLCEDLDVGKAMFMYDRCTSKQTVTSRCS